MAAELTDDTAGTTTDTDIVDDALNRAEGIVNAALKKRYTVPLTVPVSGEIRHIVLTLAKCFLFTRRRGTLSEDLQMECDEARDMLDQLAKGTLEVGATSADPDPYGGDSDADDEVFGNQVF